MLLKSLMSQRESEPEKDIFENDNDMNVKDESQLVNFYDIFNNNPVIIWYYAKWCGHCVTFVDEWNKFVLECKTKYPDVQCVKIESSLLPKLNYSHGVNSFPSIKFYNKGVESQNGAFNLERSVDNLLSYVEENLQTNTESNNMEHTNQIDNDENEENEENDDHDDINDSTKLDQYHKDFLKKKMMLWYYAKSCIHCKNMMKSWSHFKQNCKTKYPNVRIIKINANQLDKLNYKHGVDGFPTIKFYNEGKESKLGEFERKRTPTNLMNYLKHNMGNEEEEPKIVELNNTLSGKKTKKRGIQSSTMEGSVSTKRSRGRGKGSRGRGKGSRGRGKGSRSRGKGSRSRGRGRGKGSKRKGTR
jgi:thiol-disulfide isomerase/thioredoxin